MSFLLNFEYLTIATDPNFLNHHVVVDTGGAGSFLASFDAWRWRNNVFLITMFGTYRRLLDLGFLFLVGNRNF